MYQIWARLTKRGSRRFNTEFQILWKLSFILFMKTQNNATVSSGFHKPDTVSNSLQPLWTNVVRIWQIYGVSSRPGPVWSGCVGWGKGAQWNCNLGFHKQSRGFTNPSWSFPSGANWKLTSASSCRCVLSLHFMKTQVYTQSCGEAVQPQHKPPSLSLTHTRSNAAYTETQALAVKCVWRVVFTW